MGSLRRHSRQSYYELDNVMYTIGYGNRRIDDFLDLLQRYRIEAVCDVRSIPYSARHPDFGREALQGVLRTAGIKYVFLGEELGARPADPNLYVNGRASYRAMATSSSFRSGLERLEQGSERYCVTIMCAEKDPLDCHRAVLIARALSLAGITLEHIDASGVIETQPELETRLLRLYGLNQVSLFETKRKHEALDEAYERRGNELAYDVNAAYKARAVP